MRFKALAAGLVLLGAALMAPVAPASATTYSFTAEGPWRSNDGLLSGTWRAHFDVAGYDLSGTLDILGLPNVARGNIVGSWDLDHVGFGVVFTDQELMAFNGGLDGDQFVGTFEAGNIQGVWNGLLDRLSITSDPIIPILSSSIPTLLLSRIDGRVGDVVNLGATLYTLGSQIAEMGNVINFDPLTTPILAKADGKPACKVNPLIGKADTVFEFLPAGCSGSACNQVRALVTSLSNLEAITDGALLYNCKVKINKQATSGIYQVVASALAAIGVDSLPQQITSLAGEVKVRADKLGCHCSTVDTAGPLPLTSLLAPFALLALRRRSRSASQN